MCAAGHQTSLSPHGLSRSWISHIPFVPTQAKVRDMGLKWKLGPCWCGPAWHKMCIRAKVSCSFWTKCFIFSKQEHAETRLLTTPLFFPNHISKLNLGLNHQVPESCGGSTQNKVMKRGRRDEPCNVLASEPRELLVGRAHGYIWTLYSQ